MMKKFIIEISIMVSLVIATGYILYKLETPSLLANKINSIDSNLDAINLGTSHGDDFDYGEYKKNGISINKDGNTLYYDLQNFIFLDKKEVLSQNAVIIIPVSYFVFGLGENREDRLPDDSFVNDFYFYLPKNQIFNYSFKKEQTLTTYIIQRNFKELFNKEKSGHNEQEFSDEELKSLSILRAKHHRNIGNFRPKSRNVSYLIELITRAKAKGYRPVLVCTPYYKYYNEYMDKDWLQTNYFSIMNEISDTKNIPFLDYSHDRRFVDNRFYFADPDHLNNKGKSVFSKLIFDEIKNLE